MKKVAIVGGGPEEAIPDLNFYDEDVVWIGADRGAHMLLKQGIHPTEAVGDFDSVTDIERAHIGEMSNHFEEHPSEKDETDLELALQKALSYQPDVLYLFGVTGGRLDHGLINLQLLYPLEEKGIRGIVIDKGNWVELRKAGTHIVEYDDFYPNISFIPFTPEIKGITLEGFYYPLKNQDVPWGSTLCISNKLISEKGTFSFNEGILLLVKSRDVNEVSM